MTRGSAVRACTLSVSRSVMNHTVDGVLEVLGPHRRGHEGALGGVVGQDRDPGVAHDLGDGAELVVVGGHGSTLSPRRPAPASPGRRPTAQGKILGGSLLSRHEEDRVPQLRALDAVAALAGRAPPSDTLLQSIELAVAAEELGADGAYFRVHHFARQLASPFPLLAAIGARTSRIEIGTGVIDMRYENPLYMAEDAGAADLIAGGRLQLGISRGSPEQVDRRLALLRLRAGARARPTPTWRAGTPRCSCRSSRARASPGRTRARCSPTRPACCASSRTPRASATASGGAPAPTPPPRGRPRWACT